ncbi:MAG: hypothetical protein ACOCWO_00095 [Candidatus Muiribacteriaceae bacterium]
MKRFFFLIPVFFILFNNQVFSEDLMIFGNKTFNIQNTKMQGDFTRFFLENPDLSEGTSIDQSLRLKVMGDIAEGVSINAMFDDSKVENDNTEITLFLKGRNITGSMGDIMTSFEKSDLIFFNKKTRGIEIRGVQKDFYVMYARTEGKMFSEVFQGKGTQQEYRTHFYPLVRGSEVVIIDGVLLTRGTDYEMDYEDGSIYLETDILPVESSSSVFVNYQYIEDEKAFKRNTAGLSFGRKFNEFWDVSLNYFMDKDSEDKMVEDPEDTLKPSSHSVYSYITEFRKDSVSMYYEKAFCEIDNNLYSDEKVTDRPVLTKAHIFDVRYSEDPLRYRFSETEREAGFEVIGKQETQTDLFNRKGILTYKKQDLSLEYQKKDITTTVFNDPFLKITGASPVTFDIDEDMYLYSGKGRFVDVSAALTEKNEVSREGRRYKGENRNVILDVFRDRPVNYTFSYMVDSLEEKDTAVSTKDLEKLSAGLDINTESARIGYLYSDISDKGNEIISQEFDVESRSRAMNAYISLKTREEEKSENRVGDANISYNMSDALKMNMRYNSSTLSELKDSREVIIENVLSNIKVDHFTELSNASYMFNDRVRYDRNADKKENRNLMHNFDFSYNPFSQYSYRYRLSRIDTENFNEDIKFKETRSELDIVRNLNMYNNLTFGVLYTEKKDSDTVSNNWSSMSEKIAYDYNGPRFEMKLSVSSEKRKVDIGSDFDVLKFGDKLKYDIDRNANIKYAFSIREEKKDTDRKYREDELSFNRKTSGNTYIKFFYKRKDVDSDDKGKGYSYSIAGFNFDTNF